MEQILKLTDTVIENIDRYGVPVMTPDCLYYAIPLPKKFQAYLAVEAGDGSCWDIIPWKGKNKNNYPKDLTIPTRKLRKILKFLVENDVLELGGEYPFEEFKPWIDFNPKALVFRAELEDYDLNQLSIDNCDDSLAGLEDFL